MCNSNFVILSSFLLVHAPSNVDMYPLLLCVYVLFQGDDRSLIGPTVSFLSHHPVLKLICIVMSASRLLLLNVSYPFVGFILQEGCQLVSRVPTLTQ